MIDPLSAVRSMGGPCFLVNEPASRETAIAALRDPSLQKKTAPSTTDSIRQKVKGPPLAGPLL